MVDFLVILIQVADPSLGSLPAHSSADMCSPDVVASLGEPEIRSPLRTPVSQPCARHSCLGVLSAAGTHSEPQTSLVPGHVMCHRRGVGSQLEWRPELLCHRHTSHALYSCVPSPLQGSRRMWGRGHICEAFEGLAECPHSLGLDLKSWTKRGASANIPPRSKSYMTFEAQCRLSLRT